MELETGYKQDGKAQLSINTTVLLKEGEYFTIFNETSDKAAFNLVQNW